MKTFLSYSNNKNIFLLGRLKWLLLITIYFSLFTKIKSQNLVLNHSFENYKTLDLGIGPIDSLVYNWNTPINRLGSSNCFHLNSLNFDSLIPNNFAGNQTENDSNMYAGIYAYIKSLTDTIYEVRGYITGELINSLDFGKCYKVCFKYSLAEYVSHYAISNFGIYFSENIPLNNAVGYQANNLNYIPQIEINQIMNDKEN